MTHMTLHDTTGWLNEKTVQDQEALAQLDAPSTSRQLRSRPLSAATTQRRSAPQQERSAMGTNERHLALRSGARGAARTRGSYGIP